MSNNELQTLRERMEQLENLDKVAGTSDVDAFAFRRFLKENDTRSNVEHVQTMITVITRCIEQYRKIKSLVHERSFLHALPTPQPPAELSSSDWVDPRPKMLKDNLILICDAVADWRKYFSTCLPVVIDSEEVLLNLLTEVRSDVDAMATVVPPSTHRSVTPRSTYASGAASNKSRAQRKRHHVSANGLLPTAGYFPYSLGLATDAQYKKKMNDAGDSAYQEALQYLCCEYLRQLNACRRRFELVQQGKHLPILDHLALLIGVQPIPEHLLSSEVRESTNALRRLSHLFTRSELDHLHIVHDRSMHRVSINVRAAVGILASQVPPYVAQVHKAPCGPCGQMRIVSSFILLRRRFDSWIDFLDRRRMQHTAEDLLDNAMKTHMKLRLICWYRFLTSKQKLQRRKSVMKAVPALIRLGLQPQADKGLHAPSDFHAAPSESVDAPTATSATQVGKKKVQLFIQTRH